MSSSSPAQPPTAAGGPVTVAARAVFPSGSWSATVHVLLGLPIGIVTFTITITITITLVALTVGLVPTAVLAIGVAVGLLWCVGGLTAMQRSRFRALLGVDIPKVEPVFAERPGSLTLSTSTGDVRVTDAAGVVTIRTDTGDVHPSGLTSPTVEAHTGTGDIDLRFARAPSSIQVSTGTGDVGVNVDQSSAGNRSILANTDTGDITVDYGPAN